jgi:type VI secretion system secreted protein VgrG
MNWLKQRRTLELSGDAIPQWRGMSIFTVSRVSGKEKLGHLHDYTVEVATIDEAMLGVGCGFSGLHGLAENPR